MKDLHDEREAREILREACPDPKTRRTVMSILIGGIREANACDRSLWTVLGTDKTIRLLVGHYYVCTVTHEGVWLALDDRLVTPGGHRSTLQELKAWGWKPDMAGDESVYPAYKDRSMRVDFSANGYYKLGDTHAEAWPHIRKLFHDFIYKAVFYGQPMDKKSPDLHAPGILMHLRNATGNHVPDPLH